MIGTKMYKRTATMMQMMMKLSLLFLAFISLSTSLAPLMNWLALSRMLLDWSSRSYKWSNQMGTTKDAYLSILDVFHHSFYILLHDVFDLVNFVLSHTHLIQISGILVTRAHVLNNFFDVEGVDSRIVILKARVGFVEIFAYLS